MGEWIDFERWPECLVKEQPGYVFEVANEEDRRMLTRCVIPLPIPFDWESEPVRFRLAPESPPRHSAPLPQPAPRR